MSVVVLAEHRRKAAHGRHRCGLCLERIAAREIYLDQRVADNGTAWTWREHLRCGDAMWAAIKRDDSYRDIEGMDCVTWAELMAEYPDLDPRPQRPS